VERTIPNWERLVLVVDRYILIGHFSGLNRSIIGEFIEYEDRQFESSFSKMARSRYRIVINLTVWLDAHLV
jgi:hypothetical protein